MMNANEYQIHAARTLIDGPDAQYTPTQIMLVWNALGLAGEAGEVVDTIKKAVFHQHGLDRDVLIKELGDVLWYVAALCTKLDISLSEVMERNIAKLKRRYPDGYNSVASQVRVDVRRCNNCNIPLDNVTTGISIITDGEKQLTVCAACREVLGALGWSVLANARGV